MSDIEPEGVGSSVDLSSYVVGSNENFWPVPELFWNVGHLIDVL